MATTDSGSSGSPILREYDNKWVVVGLHRGTKADASADASINIATCMTAIADDVQGIPYTGEGMCIEVKTIGHGHMHISNTTHIMQCGHNEIKCLK